MHVDYDDGIYCVVLNFFNQADMGLIDCAGIYNLQDSGTSFGLALFDCHLGLLRCPVLHNAICFHFGLLVSCMSVMR